MEYKVKPGDTMYGIAKRYGVPFAELVKMNPQIADPDMVQAGQTIVVSQPGGQPGVAGPNDFAAPEADMFGNPYVGMPGYPGGMESGNPYVGMPGYPGGMESGYPYAGMPGYPGGMEPGYPYAGMPAGGIPAQPPENAVVKSPRERRLERIEKSRETKRQVTYLQQRLKELGYYNGLITGIIGKRTKAAVRRFQKDCGVSANGQMDQYLLASLGYK